MKRKQIKGIEHALKIVATHHGISVEEVRKEMEIALATGRASEDSGVQAKWKKIPHKGKFPTLEEVLLHIVKCQNRKPF